MERQKKKPGQHYLALTGFKKETRRKHSFSINFPVILPEPQAECAWWHYQKDLIMTLEENWSLFQSKLKQVTKTNNGIVGCCPAHKDQKPSLTASCNDKKILVKCQTGCTFEEIASALEMEQSQFFAPEETTLRKKIVAKYRYEYKEGNHAFDIVRFEPKDFRPQRPDRKWTLEGVERVPYHLPQLLAGIKEGKDILILEGEKDCFHI